MDDDDGDLIILIPPGKSSHALRVKQFSQYKRTWIWTNLENAPQLIEKITENKKKKKKTRKVSQISEEEHDGGRNGKKKVGQNEDSEGKRSWRRKKEETMKAVVWELGLSFPGVG